MHTILTALLIAVSTAAAATGSSGPLQRRIDPTQFAQLVEIVRAEMQAGGRYELLEPRQKEGVEAGLVRMARLLEGHERIEDLPTDEQVELLNTQESINALLTSRDRDRLMCEHQPTLGTHRKQLACQTYGEYVMRKREAREAGIKRMEREQLCRELTIPGTAANAGNGGVECR